jgi:hypothetical protein
VDTTHSSQGQTADRVLIHADTELGAKDLLNNRMAYVAVSRGAYDAQIFTNDREKLGAALGHDVSHGSAHAPEMKPEQKQEQAVTPQREIAPKQEQGEDFGLGLLGSKPPPPAAPAPRPRNRMTYVAVSRGAYDAQIFIGEEFSSVLLRPHRQQVH